jgi:carbonic anhydrase/acetyltransferase-like protein (isoleucine patch superfamily)
VAPTPRIHETAFVHASAVLIGDVTLSSRVSVWPTAVLRGDVEPIEIGDDCTIQDGVIVHGDPGMPTRIGRRVGVGHRAIVHGSIVEDDTLIAMGAIVLTGCHIGTGSIIGAGALCTEGMNVPPNSLVVGIPGKVVRQTTDKERERIRYTVERYVELSRRYLKGEY